MLAAKKQPVPPLVNNTKYPSTSQPENPPSTPIIPDFVHENRVEKYRLKSRSAELLIADAKRKGKATKKDILRHHRTIGCMVFRQKTTKRVYVHKSQTNGKAFYSGLMQCGSVWACPICAAKIQVKRAEEIKKAFKWLYEQGKKAVMLTLTFPHGISDDLKGTITKKRIAMEYYRSGRAYQDFKKNIGFIGSIRSFEVTYGEKNGWHPHDHELLIVNKNASAKSIREFALSQWKKACLKAGLLTPEKEIVFTKRAINVIDNARESDYLAKQADIKHEYYWGADKELAKASTKKGKQDGMTPFQLLAASEEKHHLGEKYIELVFATKGSQQLTWSPKLKQAVGITEKTDEEIVKEQEDKADLLACLDNDQWFVVLREKARAELLRIAEEEGFEGLQQWFKQFNLILQPPSYIDFHEWKG